MSPSTGRRKPPKKKKGQARGARTLDGAVMDVVHCGKYLGGSRGFVRARAERGLLPHRKWGGRLVFLRHEIDEFLDALDGVSVVEALENVEQRKE